MLLKKVITMYLRWLSQKKRCLPYIFMNWEITQELKSLSLDYFSLDNYLSYRKVSPLHALFIPEHSVKGTVSVITSDPVKGIVSVISSDPPCRDGNVWFTTEPSKALSYQVWIIYQCELLLFIFICGFSPKVTCAFLVYKKQWRNWQK